MPKVHVFFDLDGTLFENPYEYTPDQLKKCGSQKHLTPIVCHTLGLDPVKSKVTNYIIYKDKTAKLMRKLLDTTDVEVHFITAAAYPRDIMKHLVISYELPANAFDKCTFINRYDYETSTEWMIKAEILSLLKHDDDEFIDLVDEVVLVDDQPYQLLAAQAAGFKAIQAVGLVAHSDSNKCHYSDAYLDQIAVFVEQALARFAAEEKAQSSQRFKRSRLIR